jgi:D-3-phosphoglycerate dehydrogenase / 2-oxoglutarate reductase
MQRLQKVLLLDEPFPVLINALKDMGLNPVVHYETPRTDLPDALEDCVGIVVRSRLRIDRSLLEAAPALQWIARLGVGTEHIDLEVCAERGVEVFTSPEGSRDTVAEHAVGMLLMLMNRLAIADREVRSGDWIREGNRGTEIRGKTVGVIGYGNMGMAFAKRLNGFDVEVLAYDKYCPDHGDAFARAVDLPTLQKESDIISIHIPYTPENHYFVDGPFLEAFAKNIYLVNTARGAVLHTADLVRAMKKGKVLGAALDVIEYEEMSFSALQPDTLPEPFQYLRQSERTVLTPHIAGWSFESKAGHSRVLADKINAFYAPPRT